MELTTVEIKNFRSIKHTTLEMNPSCRVLVGINESGKSNILKALSLLDNKKQPTSADIRFALEEEEHIQDSYVEFYFTLHDDEIDQIYQNIFEGVLRKDIKQKIYIKKKGHEIDLKYFCYSRNKGLYKIDVSTGKKSARYWDLSEDIYQLEAQWAVPSEIVPDDFFINAGDNNLFLKNYWLLNRNDYPDIPNDYLVSAKPEV